MANLIRREAAGDGVWARKRITDRPEPKAVRGRGQLGVRSGQPRRLGFCCQLESSNTLGAERRKDTGEILFSRTAALRRHLMVNNGTGAGRGTRLLHELL